MQQFECTFNHTSFVPGQLPLPPPSSPVFLQLKDHLMTRKILATNANVPSIPTASNATTTTQTTWKKTAHYGLSIGGVTPPFTLMMNVPSLISIALEWVVWYLKPTPTMDLCVSGMTLMSYVAQSGMLTLVTSQRSEVMWKWLSRKGIMLCSWDSKFHFPSTY